MADSGCLLSAVDSLVHYSRELPQRTRAAGRCRAQVLHVRRGGPHEPRLPQAWRRCTKRRPHDDVLQLRPAWPHQPRLPSAAPRRPRRLRRAAARSHMLQLRPGGSPFARLPERTARWRQQPDPYVLQVRQARPHLPRLPRSISEARVEEVKLDGMLER